VHLTVNLLFDGQRRRMTQYFRLSLVPLRAGPSRVSFCIGSVHSSRKLALCRTSFEKTVIDCFLCTNPAGGANKKQVERPVFLLAPFLLRLESVILDYWSVLCRLGVARCTRLLITISLCYPVVIFHLKKASGNLTVGFLKNSKSR